MRKTIAILSVLILVASMCSCEDKPFESEPIGETTISVGAENTSEPVYLELNEEDFDLVDINCEINDSNPPVDIQCTDLSGLDFGERMSPCKALDVNYDLFSLDDIEPELREMYEEQNEKYKLAMNRIREKACSGMVENTEFLEGKLYISVNYDDLCGAHDSSLYSYDVETGDFKEVVRHSGLEYNGCFNGLKAAHGKLYYYKTEYTDANGEPLGNDENNTLPVTGEIAIVDIPTEGDIIEKTTFYSIDPETGNEEKVCTVDGFVFWFQESKNGLGIDRAIVEKNSDLISEFVEYNFETKELSESQEWALGTSTGTQFLCDGVPATVSGGLTNGGYEKISVSTQYYTVNTELNYYSFVFLWKDKFVIITDEQISGTWMYTYDLVKRERLKMKVDGFNFSDALQTDEGLLLVVESGVQDSGYSMKMARRIYYVMPLLGMVFKMDVCDEVMMGKNDDAVYYMTISGGQSGYDAENHIYAGYSTSKGLPEKLYMFREK
ncbi:MAG: hypothetical protein J6Y71_06165 [Ruminococcus sp.]|nr:hypothetical protein [Ruminococcus sp.]